MLCPAAIRFETRRGGALEAGPWLLETPLPTLRLGDIALTATPARDEAGARAQLVRRQPDGTWLRVLDRPDFRR
jgi:hypothetical protein